MIEIGRCRDCRRWEAEYNGLGLPSGDGRCLAVASNSVPGNDDLAFIAVWGRTGAATFHTRADFGCSQFEARG